MSLATPTTSTERPARGAAGLSTAEAERRLAEAGPNAIVQAKGPSPLREFAANLVQPLALLLWACAALALLAGMPELTVAIAAVVVVNAVFSFMEEYRAGGQRTAADASEPRARAARRRGGGDPG